MLFCIFCFFCFFFNLKKKLKFLFSKFINIDFHLHFVERKRKCFENLKKLKKK